jgi:hypothetical protein
MDMDFQKIYYPGKLLVLTNEVFNKMKINYKDNNILYWQDYTNTYFKQTCTFSLVMEREVKSWVFSK